MTRLLIGLMVAGAIGLCTRNASAQYYVPSFVPVFQFTQPAPVVYYSVPRNDFRYNYYPRRGRTTVYPYPVYGGPVYNIYGPRTITTRRPAVTTESRRPRGVHPSQYIGNPHASQYMGNPHASQYFPK